MSRLIVLSSCVLQHFSFWTVKPVFAWSVVYRIDVSIFTLLYFLEQNQLSKNTRATIAGRVPVRANAQKP